MTTFAAHAAPGSGKGVRVVVLGAGIAGLVAALLEPDGPIYFAGDHISHIVGWQEGAAISGVRAADRRPCKGREVYASVAGEPLSASLR